MTAPALCCSRREDGVALMEVVVATAFIASGVMLLVALLVQADTALRAARHRTMAPLLARATLEGLTAGIDRGEGPSTGGEHLDEQGRPVATGTGTYVRRWSVTPFSLHPHLLLVEVEVTAAPDVQMAGATTRLRTLRRTP